MGFVVHATHVQLDEPMALKFLRRDLMGVPGVVERFAQEARASAKLKSEHAVRVFDVGFTDDGSPYLVMEYLEGSDLSRVLTARGPLPVEEAVRYLVEACDALAEAHALGIVHRDVKPENLFLAERPGHPARIKVLDFGISKFGLAGVSGESPGTIMTMGSPSYMSPEQLRSTHDVDAQADIWSLGVVLYELLTTELPFDQAQQFADISAAILRESPRPLTKFAPYVPRELEAVVLRCLEKDPSRRHRGAADLASALRPYAAGDTCSLIDRIIEGAAHAGLSEMRWRRTGNIPKAAVTHVSSAPSRPGLGQAGGPPLTRDEGGPQRRPPAKIHPGNVERVRAIMELLAERVGPFARVLVQRELRALGVDVTALDAAALDDLVLRLATKIPQAKDRRAFLDDVNGAGAGTQEKPR